MPAHDPTKWHPYNGDHHHGYDPKLFLANFGAPLVDYLAQYDEIGYPWATSAVEEHEGYLWLYTAMRPGEVIFNNGGKLPVNELHYVREVLMQVHSDGHAHHLRKRYHSHYAFLRIENRDTGASGVVATGGWVDFGIFHAPYKQKHWPLPSDPPGFTNLNQPPYRSSQTQYRKPGEMVQFWSGLWPNASVMQYFPDAPQHILGVAWSELDAPEYPDPNHADDEEYDQPAVHPGHKRFQIFTTQVRNLPAAPFVGWTNRYGHVVAETGLPGVDQVPLVVTGNVPLEPAMLNRPVQHNNPDAAPIMEF